MIGASVGTTAYRGMNRAGQILELLLAERRDIEAVAGHRFDRRASLQLDRLIAAEELIRDYQANTPDSIVTFRNDTIPSDVQALPQDEEGRP